MAFDYWQPLEEGLFYHLYNRSVNKERLFKKDSDYLEFLEKVSKYLLPYVDIYSYCLIPNHFHFLVQIHFLDDAVKLHLEKEDSKAAGKLLSGEISMDGFLEDQFRRMFSGYALSYNHRYKRTGTLFQKRLKRVGISSDARLLHAICYIHHNGIHHKLVRQYADWRYSSYNAILSDKPTLVCREKVLEWFGYGDSEKGKHLFLQYHAEYRHPPFEDWMIDSED